LSGKALQAIPRDRNREDGAGEQAILSSQQGSIRKVPPGIVMPLLHL
jgi:hypothetical protein